MRQLLLLILALVFAIWVAQVAAPPERLGLWILVDDSLQQPDSVAQEALEFAAREAGLEVEYVASLTSLSRPEAQAVVGIVLARAPKGESHGSLDSEDAPGAPEGTRVALEQFVQRGGAVAVLPSARQRIADWPWWDRLVGSRPAPTAVWGATPPALAATVTYDGGRVARFDAEPSDGAAAVELDRSLTPRQAMAWLLPSDSAGVEASGRIGSKKLALPADGCFEVQDLAIDLNDPMEMDVADNGDVYVLEREGRLVRLVAAAGYRQEVVAQLTVAGGRPGGTVAQECGGLGLALDPDFAQTKRIFMFYSPPEPSVHRLSRFTVSDAMGPASLVDERVLLEVPTDRENTTCHEGGSLAFGPDGNLFLSVGDNTNPFESNGYAPIDERADRLWWDAQRSASNSNDLRGGIVRIRPTEDGSYAIPDGNLYAPGTPNTRPELYVKGCRNPFRMAVDSLTGDVYWGDVGPDASDDGEAGTRGFDEFNRAQAAGFFGWPYYRGGVPYVDRNFTTDELGPSFDEVLVNDSPNNTGIHELPPAVAPFFAYPYSDDERLPELRSGSRNAMAGPIFRGPYDQDAGGFPPYFDGKPLFYDWARGHMFICSPNAAGELGTMHRFLADLVLKHPMDTAIGPNGELFLLEYGSDWYFNTDGRVRRISFTGYNQPPQVTLEASRSDGLLPLEVTLVAEVNGEEHGLTFDWDLAGGQRIDREPGQAMGEARRVTVRFDKPGMVRPGVTVTDAAGSSATAEVSVIAGDQRPELVLAFDSPDAEREWGDSVPFTLQVGDPGADLESLLDSLQVKASLHADGAPTSAAQDHPLLPGLSMDDPGAKVMVEYGCTACHSTQRQSVGPSYIEVAKRLALVPDTAAERQRLVDKITRGGGGAYGAVVMPPQSHVPPLALERALDTIVSLVPAEGASADDSIRVEILSMATKESGDSTVSGPGRTVHGVLHLPSSSPGDPSRASGEILIEASYTDSGLPVSAGLSLAGSLPLKGAARLVMRAPVKAWTIAGAKSVVSATGATIMGDGARMEADNVGYYSGPETQLSWMLDFPMAGVFQVILALACDPNEAGSTFTVSLAGSAFLGTVPATGGWQDYAELRLGEITIPAPGRYEMRFAPVEMQGNAVGNIGDFTLQSKAR